MPDLKKKEFLSQAYYYDCSTPDDIRMQLENALKLLSTLLFMRIVIKCNHFSEFKVTKKRIDRKSAFGILVDSSFLFLSVVRLSIRNASGHRA